MLCCIAVPVCCGAVMQSCGKKKEHPAVTAYNKKAGIVSANSNAKALYLSLNSALTDMNANDISVSDAEKLAGVYYFQGRDFEFDTPPGDSASPEEKFRYSVSVYYPEIVNLDEIAYELQNMNVLAAAVKCRHSDDPGSYYGTWPRLMSAEEFDKTDSLETALQYALEYTDRD